MSPRTADPAIRRALVEAAARSIAAHEPLSTRKLAAEVGSSTMSVYTHFGSMEELRREVRREGFARLADHLSRVEQTDDPLVDVARQGWEYCMNAVENPNLYRAMFMETAIDEADAEVGFYTFQMLIDVLQRCIDAELFTETDAEWLAMQVWTSIHGSVALYVTGFLDLDTLLRVTLVAARTQFVSFGASPERVDRSLAAANFGPVPQTA
ncbi:MAG TPA: TetR/AcrR family transcriptional regulator [Actinomycetota bacterium]|nr:TetR/AcrR family transcriptional regulator [Actinomycetota bacterium]